jgi:hypothetical protein
MTKHNTQLYQLTHTHTNTHKHYPSSVGIGPVKLLYPKLRYAVNLVNNLCENNKCGKF